MLLCRKLIAGIEACVLLVYEEFAEGKILYADLYFIGVCAAQVCLQNTIKYRSARSVLFGVAVYVGSEGASATTVMIRVIITIKILNDFSFKHLHPEFFNHVKAF